jgi:hypothetical protein
MNYSTQLHLAGYFYKNSVLQVILGVAKDFKRVYPCRMVNVGLVPKIPL